MLGAPAVLLAFLFETPWAAVAAAAAAASIPIVIHLLNRNRYRVVVWAAMRFLLGAQRKNTRRMRLEQFLLLAVRTAIVLLLVLAMTSVMPWTESLWQRFAPNAAALAAAGNRRTHRILVIDGSLSMALKTDGTTCFERARAAAVRILRESRGGDGFSLILLASPPRRIVSEPSDDAVKVADEVNALHLTHGQADVAGALTAIEDLVRKSPEKFLEREVYFLTDLQRSTWAVAPASDPNTTIQKIQSRARTIFVDVGQDGANNLAITNLAIDLPMITTGADVTITASVGNYGREAAKEKKIELYVGKARKEAADDPFELQVQHQQVVNVPPGEATDVAFPFRFRTPGEYAVQVRLENDALELDDVRSMVVAVKNTAPVMLVNGKPAAELYDRATEWLKDALNPFASEAAPRNVPARPKVLTETQFADVGSGDLTAFDCVFLCDVARLSGSEIRRLETHLQRGGGVVICLGPQVDLEAYNRLLYRNGEGILPARLMGLQRAPAGHSFSFHGDRDAYQLPPLRLFEGDARLSLEAARFRQYVRVELPPRSRARRILSFIQTPEINAERARRPDDDQPTRSAADPPPSSDPAVLTWQRYRGQVVLLTSTVNMDWTSWPISPSYPPFMQELLRFAVSGRLREQSALVGEPLEEVLPVGSAGLDVTIHTPEGRHEETRTQDRDENALLRWTDTDVSGIYRATYGKYGRDYLFAVNVPTATDTQQASESDLTRTNAEELHNVFPGWDFQVVKDPAEIHYASGPAALVAATGSISGLGAVVARYLLLAMLILLIIDVVLAWRFGHHTTATGVDDQPPSSGRWLPGFIGVFAGAVFLTIAGILLHAVWTGDFLGFLPQALRRSFEAGLNVPPPTPGEGTRWRLEFTPYLRDSVTDPGLATLFALAIAGSIVVIYWHEGTTARRPFKLFLASLRIGVILLTMAVFLPQLHLMFERQSWPGVVILIDDSRSMSHVDRFQDPRVREAADHLAEFGSLSSPERLQLAQALLTGGGPNWLEILVTGRQVKLHVYHCSGRAARLADVTDDANPAQRAGAAQAIRDLRADGESSQLGTAVRQVLDDFRGVSLAGVIMLTDGVTTEGEDLPKVARYAAQMKVPLFFIGIGDTKQLREIKLHDLQVEDSVYVNDRIVFESRITAQGYPDLTIDVSLKEKGKDKALATKSVHVDPDGKPVRVRLFHRPTEPGEKTFVLEMQPPLEEGKPAPKQKLERTVFVRENKLIKVLYVEGTARYEFRYLKHLLERESAQDARNKTVDLKVLLLDADHEYPKLDKSAVAEFPSKAELNQFDAIVLGDVDPKDPRVAKHLPAVADFVRERGGGLLMIAGESYSPRAYKDTALAAVLPVEATAGEPVESDYTRGFRPGLTATGRFHPIFRFQPDEADNTAVWNRLAPLFWWAQGFRAKPGAEVLAFHKAQQSSNADSPGAPHSDHPLIIQQFVGAGRCLFFGTDETWRWRFRENELHYNQFWIQVVRHLARSRLGRVELRLDRQTPYQRGEPIKVTVRFPDDSPQPSPESAVKVLVERTAAASTGSGELEGETLTLAKVEGSRATFEGTLTRTPAGDYRFWLSAPVVNDSKPRAECRVLLPPGEMDRLHMNQADMERAADETHGRFYSLADANDLLTDLPAGIRVTSSSSQPPWLLWNHPALFVVALSVLTAEWFLRKRKHLL
jgi:hypothetical protein